MVILKIENFFMGRVVRQIFHYPKNFLREWNNYKGGKKIEFINNYDYNIVFNKKIFKKSFLLYKR